MEVKRPTFVQSLLVSSGGIVLKFRVRILLYSCRLEEWREPRLIYFSTRWTRWRLDCNLHRASLIPGDFEVYTRVLEALWLEVLLEVRSLLHSPSSFLISIRELLAALFFSTYDTLKRTLPQANPALNHMLSASIAEVVRPSLWSSSCYDLTDLGSSGGLFSPSTYGGRQE